MLTRCQLRVQAESILHNSQLSKTCPSNAIDPLCPHQTATAIFVRIAFASASFAKLTDSAHQYGHAHSAFNQNATGSRGCLGQLAAWAQTLTSYGRLGLHFSAAAATQVMRTPNKREYQAILSCLLGLVFIRAHLLHSPATNRLCVSRIDKTESVRGVWRKRFISSTICL